MTSDADVELEFCEYHLGVRIAFCGLEPELFHEPDAPLLVALVRVEDALDD